MSEFKHTPGPWRVGDAGATVFGPFSGEPSPKTIARLPKVSAPCKVTDIDESIANARLIAAAPELLTVVRSAASWFGELGNDDGAQGLLDDLRAAIAKATGQ